MTGLSRRPLIAGNWKMNLDHFTAIAHLQKIAFTLRPQETDAVEVVVLVPFTDLRSVQTLVDADHLEIGYGAQDLSPHADGPHTGDVSGAMLARLGAGYVIVGHSERRGEHAETDAEVAAKAVAAYQHGLTPILCVGEDQDVRDAGRAGEVVTAQLRASVAGLRPAQLASLVVAYEPIWAIGTGATAGPQDAQEMAAALRAVLGELAPAAAGSARLLYGGSVTPDNASVILGQPDVDGALVGGASLHAESFAAIVRASPPLAG